MAKFIAVALSVVALAGCGSEGVSDERTDYPEVSDELIDNGDGTVTIPESWLADVVEVAESPVSSASDVIEKAVDQRIAVGPNVSSRNFTYSLTLPYGGGGSGNVTAMFYKWNLSYKPAGLVVTLCRNGTVNCIVVTGAQSGSAPLFVGNPSNVPFTYLFRVNGAPGVVSPTALGQSDEVLINY